VKKNAAINFENRPDKQRQNVSKPIKKYVFSVSALAPSTLAVRFCAFFRFGKYGF
jgi:hypothetical protein